MSVVDRRVLDEIERVVLTPEARRLVLEAAERALSMEGAEARNTLAQLCASLTRVTREIENLLRAVEFGNQLPVLVERLREREQERSTLQTRRAQVERTNSASALDRRIRRILDEGLETVERRSVAGSGCCPPLRFPAAGSP